MDVGSSHAWIRTPTPIKDSPDYGGYSLATDSVTTNAKTD
jgi:hypothetical protein